MQAANDEEKVVDQRTMRKLLKGRRRVLNKRDV